MPARRKSKSRSKSPRRVRRLSGSRKAHTSRRVTRSPKRTYKGTDTRLYGSETPSIHISTLTTLPAGATDLGLVTASHTFQVRSGKLLGLGQTTISEFSGQMDNERSILRNALEKEVEKLNGNAMYGYSVTSTSSQVYADSLVGTKVNQDITYVLLVARATAVRMPPV